MNCITPHDPPRPANESGIYCDKCEERRDEWRAEQRENRETLNRYIENSRLPQ